MSNHLASKIFILTFLYTSTTSAACIEDRPSDFNKFINTAETCIHLSGELTGEQSSSQNKLIKEANKACLSAKKQLKKLDKKYNTDAEIKKTLDEYRNEIEDVE